MNLTWATLGDRIFGRRVPAIRHLPPGEDSRREPSAAAREGGSSVSTVTEFCGTSRQCMIHNGNGLPAVFRGQRMVMGLHWERR